MKRDARGETVVQAGRLLSSMLAPLMAPLVAIGLGSACGGSGARLDVFAPASLGSTFEALAVRFEAAHPGLDVVVNVAGSQTLASQLEAGAPCDVIATADQATLATLFTARRTEHAIDFARNHLVVVVPKTNPAGLGSWEDLARARTIALGADEVPVGRYARHFLRQSVRLKGASFEREILIHVASYERDVKHVLGRVLRREVEAGIVYASDARAAGADVIALPIPKALEPAILYPIARTRQSARPELADAFIALVRSDEGKSRLVSAGLEPLP